MPDVSAAPRAASRRETGFELPFPGPGLALAGRGRRLAATCIDGLLMAPIVLPLFAAVAGEDLLAALLREPPSIWTILRGLAPGLLACAVIQGAFLHAGARTIGKKLLGLRIVRSDGSRPGLPRLLFVRAGLGIALALIPLVGPFIALADALLILRPARQCLHDQIADTFVVRDAAARDFGVRPPA